MTVRSCFLGPVNPLSLDCDHDAGLAHAELGDHEHAVPPLQRFVDLAEPADERLLDARMSLAVMLVVSGDRERGEAELRRVRTLAGDMHGTDSAQVRNVDRQIARLSATAG